MPYTWLAMCILSLDIVLKHTECTLRVNYSFFMFSVAYNFEGNVSVTSLSSATVQCSSS